MLSEEEYKKILTNIPEHPGIYKYYDRHNTLIYVGKAKDLKKRIYSYFSNIEKHDAKTYSLVNQIQNVEFTLVDSEYDALIIENALIKENQPKYNILLKDDKTFPYLVLTNEPFPRLISTRKVNFSIGTYYGPYTSVAAMEVVKEFIHKLFQLRTCTLSLTEKNIKENKFKVCLEYHIKNCTGPCVGKEREVENNEKIKQIHQILKGNTNTVKNFFQHEMKHFAENLEFEKAQDCKEKLVLIEKFHNNHVVVPQMEEGSVFYLEGDENFVVISYLKIIQGTIIQSKNVHFKRKLHEPDEEILCLVMFNLREKFEDRSKEILCNMEVDFPEKGVTVQVPQRGDKKNVLEIAGLNAKHHYKKIKIQGEQTSTERKLLTLQKDLYLKELPIHIECFDNSNFQGTDAVSAMVCFKDAKPSKKDYRIFNVKTVEGPDDFATMREVVYRRYKRMKEENLTLPQLIIVDGGKGQLSAAIESLKQLDLYSKIAIIGIAKNLEEIFFPNDEFPVYLDKKSESLRIIQHLRDEAHRFGITKHRNKRSKSSIHSELDEIKEIGDKTKLKLLKRFKSIKGIREASLDELMKEVDRKRAEIIYQFFKNKT